MYHSMKTFSKTIPVLSTCLPIIKITLLLIAGILLQSCIMTTVVQEIENTVTSAPEHHTTKGENLKEGHLTLQIQNNAENTMLQIDSLEICNMQVDDSSMSSITLLKTPMQLKYGTDTSTTYNHATHLIITQNTYAQIHGTLHSYLPNNETYPIYSGTMYYPISVTTTINIHPNCPLYAIINSTPQKILQPITFTATVEDWE